MKSEYCKKLTFGDKMSVLKVTALLGSWLLLSACELLPKSMTAKDQTQPELPDEQSVSTELCTNQEQEVQYKQWCNLEYFLEYAIKTSSLTWPERKTKIEALGEESHMLIEKVMLSQGTITPYKDRLRAQNWIIKASGDASSAMNSLLNTFIYENSKQLLEFESAITILSRVNARQEKAIDELQSQVDEKEEQIQIQQDQVEQLLKIESDLIEQNRNEKR